MHEHVKFKRCKGGCFLNIPLIGKYAVIKSNEGEIMDMRNWITVRECLSSNDINFHSDGKLLFLV